MVDGSIVMADDDDSDGGWQTAKRKTVVLHSSLDGNCVHDTENNVYYARVSITVGHADMYPPHVVIVVVIV